MAGKTEWPDNFAVLRRNRKKFFYKITECPKGKLNSVHFPCSPFFKKNYVNATEMPSIQFHETKVSASVTACVYI
jgi:hypothetical protein